MKALYPTLADPHELPRRALVVAPHADDEVFGCGGMMAFHAERGDELRVLILSDGAQGDPRGLSSDLARLRERESRAAGAALGVRDYRFLGLPDGQLSAQADLAARLAAELDEYDPQLVYGPAPQEMHPDHRAVSHALLSALARGRERRVLLYGVNRQATCNTLYDTTRYWPRKRAAIERFESQLAYHDLVGKTQAVDRSHTVNIEDGRVLNAEGFAALTSRATGDYEGGVARLLDALYGAGHGLEPRRAPPGSEATAVICTWNKRDVLRANLDSLRAQTQPFASIVVVDNASTDGTGELLAREYPEVRLVRMPHSRYGACETFNIGFACATTPLIAILDDDIVLPPDWLERASARLAAEPPSTAILSTKVVEPGMPESYRDAPEVNRERYMSTFRGCGSLARREALERAGGYDERLFIYGNERDLTCRLLNLGYRVLQHPQVVTYHMNPFGVRMGPRSLYYHARNAWLTQLKYAPLGDLLRMPWLVLTRVLLRSRGSEGAGAVADATGTIGIGKSLRETPGAPWILCKAAWSVLLHLPYCWKHRQPVRAPDYELPLR